MAVPLSSLAYLFGLGASWNDPGGYGGAVDDLPTHLAVQLDAGYLVERGLVVGGHARFSSAHAWEWDSDNDSATTWDSVMRTLDIGASGTLNAGAFFVEPWLGLHLAYTTKRTNRTIFGPPDIADNSVDSYLAHPLLAVGFLLGVEVPTTRRFRPSLYAEVEECLSISPVMGQTAGREYAAITFGIAVRR